jgi:hypothetical protein
MAAMRNRHVFAATDRIVCEFYIGSAMMGDMLRLPEKTGALDVYIHIQGTGDIREVTLLKNSEPYHTWQVQGNETELRLSISDEDAVGNYFYVRMIQHDTNMAWSSPIWIDSPIM